MRKLLAIAVLVLGTVAVAQAKDRPAYEKAKLTKMESVPCSFDDPALPVR